MVSSGAFNAMSSIRERKEIIRNLGSQAVMGFKNFGFQNGINLPTFAWTDVYKV